MPQQLLRSCYGQNFAHPEFETDFECDDSHESVDTALASTEPAGNGDAGMKSAGSCY